MSRIRKYINGSFPGSQIQFLVLTRAGVRKPQIGLGSDGSWVFSDARRAKFHFIKLMRRAIFVFRYIRFSGTDVGGANQDQLH